MSLKIPSTALHANSTAALAEFAATNRASLKSRFAWEDSQADAANSFTFLSSFSRATIEALGSDGSKSNSPVGG
jgi:hypothetical protein